MSGTQTDWHAMSVRETFRALGSREKGISAVEAVVRLARSGPNELPRAAARPTWRVAVDQFGNPLMVILLAAATVSAVLGEVSDAAVIGAAVVLNSLLGFAQEYKADQAMERLRHLVRPTTVVRRDGADVVVDARTVVPGDVLALSSGDQIPADARVFECVSGEANEAPLTGESNPVPKGVDACLPGAIVADRSSMVFAGTALVAGRALAVVVATGTETELGNIARLVGQTEERPTPLQLELKRLATWLSAGVTALVVVIFAIGVFSGRDALGMFQTSVALAVAAIPEGLGISVTIILAIGMQRMVRRNALVRRLVAAETLGSVSVICTDKTGTITEGRMRAEEFLGDRDMLLELAVLCNDAVPQDGASRGSPTERALMDAAVAAGVRPRELEARFPRVAERPFDSIAKYMATLHADGSKRLLVVKGAPERVLPMCRNGEGRMADATEYASRGLRLIAFARKSATKDTLEDGDLHGLSFVGFVALRDPLRAEAAAHIREARQAGVRTVIVTGDHPRTARAIGAEAGLSLDDESVVTGAELDRWDEAQLDARLPGIQVYARVEPRHKIRVVNAWQRRGAVVAVTGDGVNDAPALKAADIGVALGSGTEVAKESSDMVLLDDNLGSVTAAIEQGRVIFDNMRRSVVYLFTSGFTETILIGGGLLFGLPLPLFPAQILWINLVADSFPNAALALERGEPDRMRLPPRPRNEPVFNRQMGLLLVAAGVVTDVLLFCLYARMLGEREPAQAQAFMFLAVGICSLVYVFSLRSFRRPFLSVDPWSNPWLLGAVVLSFGLLVFPMYQPWFSAMIHVMPLSLSDWGLLAMIGVGKLFVIEAVKLLSTRYL